MTFDDFKKNPPKKVRVFDKGLGKNLIVRLTNDNRYITKNMGTSKKRVFHYWSLENVFQARMN